MEGSKGERGGGKAFGFRGCRKTLGARGGRCRARERRDQVSVLKRSLRGVEKRHSGVRVTAGRWKLCQWKREVMVAWMVAVLAVEVVESVPI